MFSEVLLSVCITGSSSCFEALSDFSSRSKIGFSESKHLDGLQGSQVPVCLGTIDLRDMGRIYYYDHRVYIEYMLLLSHGSPIDEAVRAGEVKRCLRAIHRACVVHRDVRRTNVLRNTDTGELMLIDFERSVVKAGRKPLSNIVPNKRSWNGQRKGITAPMYSHAPGDASYEEDILQAGVEFPEKGVFAVPAACACKPRKTDVTASMATSFKTVFQNTQMWMDVYQNCGYSFQVEAFVDRAGQIPTVIKCGTFATLDQANRVVLQVFSEDSKSLMAERYEKMVFRETNEVPTSGHWTGYCFGVYHPVLRLWAKQEQLWSFRVEATISPRDVSV
ncbi:hypothetical protein TruAng_012073 [Truncatella angustata]|nr:hypothetical protein TruAng_012073 [Truncatella angustata]